MKTIVLLLTVFSFKSAMAQYIPNDQDRIETCTYSIKNILKNIPELERTIIYNPKKDKMVVTIPNGGVIISDNKKGTKFASATLCTKTNPEYKHKQVLERLLDKMRDAAKENPVVFSRLSEEIRKSSVFPFHTCSSLKGYDSLHETLKKRHQSSDSDIIYESQAPSVSVE